MMIEMMMKTIEDDDEEDESDSGSDYIPEHPDYQDYCHVSWVRQGITLATQKGLRYSYSNRLAFGRFSFVSAVTWISP
jgi:hypothetical protein